MINLLFATLSLFLLQEPNAQPPQPKSSQDWAELIVVKFILPLLLAALAASPFKETVTQAFRGRRVRRGKNAPPEGAAAVRLLKFSGVSRPGGRPDPRSLLTTAVGQVSSLVVVWAAGIWWMIDLLEGGDTFGQTVAVVIVVSLQAFTILVFIMVSQILYGYYVLRWMPDERRAKANREADLVVGGDIDQVIEQCKESLKAARMRLDAVDVDGGSVIGVRQHRWLSVLDAHGLTRTIRATITSTDNGRHKISVACHGNRSGLTADGYANQALLNRFIAPFLA